MLTKIRANYGLQKTIRFLSSMRLGIFLLLFLAALMSVGSLIPQGQSEGFYRAHYGEVLGGFIRLLSLDHLYSAWWFVGLSVFFALNILFCAVHRIKLSPKNYRVVGSFLLHLSILVIVSGAYISGLTGHSEYVEIGVGDSLDLSSRGFPGRVLTVKDFRIEYYDNLTPKQYISDLVLTTSKGESIQREIRVNHPLKADGLKIYQVHYGWMIKGEITLDSKLIPFDLVSGGEFIIDPSTNTRLKIFFVPDFDAHGGLRSKTPLPRNPKAVFALVRNNLVVDVQALAEGETKEVGGYPVTFSDYRYYTGLQVKTDKGLPVVFGGFVLLTLGIAIRYMSPKTGHERGEQKLWK